MRAVLQGCTATRAQLKEPAMLLPCFPALHPCSSAIPTLASSSASAPRPRCLLSAIATDNFASRSASLSPRPTTTETLRQDSASPHALTLPPTLPTQRPICALCGAPILLSGTTTRRFASKTVRQVTETIVVVPVWPCAPSWPTPSVSATAPPATQFVFRCVRPLTSPKT
jgi:hypothetical protein